MEGLQDGPWRDFVEAVVETGCRPVELARATAGDLDAVSGTLTVPNKTRHATGRPTRTIYLSPRALQILVRLAATHPEGPLFRNTCGRPWTDCAWGRRWRQLRDQLGLPKQFVIYSLRHAFATDAIAQGVNPFILAELIGHTNPMMVAKVYSQIAQRRQALRDAVATIRPGTPPVPAPADAAHIPAAAPPASAPDADPGTHRGQRG
jgi:integrase